MTTHPEVVVGQELFLGDLMPESDTVTHYRLVWIRPDTRLALRLSDQTPGIAVDSPVRFDRRPEPDAVLIFWGDIAADEARLTLGEYLPYPPADGVPVASNPDPVNQIPHQRDFLNHCCTFAHELLTDFHPHAPAPASRRLVERRA